MTEQDVDKVLQQPMQQILQILATRPSAKATFEMVQKTLFSPQKIAQYKHQMRLAGDLDLSK